MLKQEKERAFQDIQELRAKSQQERMLLDVKIDELRLEINKKDDQLRRLEFEVEKSTKTNLVNSSNSTQLTKEALESLKLDGKTDLKPLMTILSG